MAKNAAKRRKQQRKEKHRGRPRYKACDPFSGRSYQEEDPDTMNLEPDANELDSGSDHVVEEIDTYKTYKEKPKYRRDSRVQLRVLMHSYFRRRIGRHEEAEESRKDKARPGLTGSRANALFFNLESVSAQTR